MTLLSMAKQISSDPKKSSSVSVIAALTQPCAAGVLGVIGSDHLPDPLAVGFRLADCRRCRPPESPSRAARSCSGYLASQHAISASADAVESIAK